MSTATVRVQKATSDLLIDPDWTMNINICDSVNKNHCLTDAQTTLGSFAWEMQLAMLYFKDTWFNGSDCLLACCMPPTHAFCFCRQFLTT
ncbi:hypothetical protein MRB53_033029 [Persea americana]|uniref:Uncharacterized protein n=1 Tax=Persea americana TaxID=3435 RepID=A0ACC2KTI5_PERAE|nr:hypothetical protein MRB53_033029 [Persea americana]